MQKRLPRRAKAQWRVSPATEWSFTRLLDEADEFPEDRDTDDQQDQHLDADDALGVVLARRILDANPGLAEGLRRGCVSLVVETNSADLSGPLLDGLATAAMGTRRDDFAAPGSVRWLSFLPTGKERTNRPDEGNAAVRAALAGGQPIVGISHAPERFLPSDLLRIADHRVRVPDLDAAALREIAELVTGQSSEMAIPENEARRVTVADLCLAVRPKQDADAFLKRALALAADRSRAPSLTLDRLHGMDAVVRWGRNLATDLADYAAGRIGWDGVDRGALLVGPPGTGKTMAARAIAGTCGVPLIVGSFARWQASGYLNDMLKAMHADFDEARLRAPCILFIDELDAVGDRATFMGKNSNYETQVVNGFLEQLDGITGREGVVVIGATNWPDRIDPAVRRPGRLDKEIQIGMPDARAMSGILRFHLGTDLLSADLSQVALLCSGSSGAQAEQYVRDARRIARQAGRALEVDDLTRAIRGGRPQLSRDEIRRVAIHEAGHALLASLERPGALKGVSILPTSNSGGWVEVSFGDGRMLTPAGIHARLRYILGGRAAEEVVLGIPSTGAGGDEESDLARATSVALSALTTMGMREGDRRLLWTGYCEREEIRHVLTSDPGLADEASGMLNTAYAQAVQAIRQYRSALLEIADMMLAREVLQGREVDEVVARHRSLVVATGKSREGIRESREALATLR